MDPYRIYFPLGSLAAILGTGAWIAFGFGAPVLYPGVYHADLMIGGFLFAFSCGFLMTAVPQFTGSHHASAGELWGSSFLVIALLAFGFFSSRAPFHIFSAISLAVLILFCARRVVRRTYDPPRFFVFVGLGLLMGISGAVLLALSDLGLLGPGAAAFGKLIYTQGMILSLILGVGTHLLPAILGWSDLPIQITWFGKEESAWKKLGPVLGLAAALLAGFLVEVFAEPTVGRAIRALLVSYLALRYWHLLKKPKTRGRLAFWLWISAWSLVIGLWVPVFSPTHWVDGIHIAFVGGFGLMTFMVASRVTRAHGGHGVGLEIRSRALPVTGILILAAAITRASAGLLPDLYLHHLAYAAGTWILGVSVWSFALIPKMIKLRSS